MTFGEVMWMVALLLVLFFKKWHGNRYDNHCDLIPAVALCVRHYTRGGRVTDERCVTLMVGWLWWHTETRLWNIAPKPPED